MGGHQHAANGIDERPDPVAAKFRAQGIAQRRQVATLAQLWQGLALLDGLADLALGGAGVNEAGLPPLLGVALIQLVHQQVQAAQVVAHGQGGHAINAGLEQFLRIALAELSDDVTALLLAAATDAEDQQRGKHRLPAPWRGSNRTIITHRQQARTHWRHRESVPPAPE
ncbi:hypothetical protein D3C77_264440 [compost metagenome]